jgi:hypothetical protein
VIDRDSCSFICIWMCIYIYVVLWWLVTDSWLFRGSNSGEGTQRPWVNSAGDRWFSPPPRVLKHGGPLGNPNLAMEVDSWVNDLHDLCDLYDLPFGYLT